MKTEFAFPDDDLQRAGEICESCRVFWETQEIRPRRLVFLVDDRRHVISTNGGIPIVICPHCDGAEILRYHKE